MSTLRGAMAGAIAVAVLTSACSGAKNKERAAPVTTTSAAPTTSTEAPPAPPPDERPSGPLALASFASCAALVDHVKAHALKVATPHGIPSIRGSMGGVDQTRMLAEATAGGTAGDSAGPEGAPSASTAGSGGGPSFSGTNIQEQGVDEPDIVKTDGRRMVTLFNNKIVITDLTQAVPKVIGSVALPPEDVAANLLLAGDRLVVMGHRVAREERPQDAAVYRIGGFRTASFARVIDISKPAAPTTTATVSLDGSYVSARLVGGVVRVVLHSAPSGPTVTVPMTPNGVDEGKALALYKAAIQQSKAEDWLPSFTLERPGQKAVTKPLAPCTAVLHPKDFGGLDAVSVLTLDPADPQPVSPACVLGGGRIVYSATQNLYVATEQWDARVATPAPSVRPGGGASATRSLPQTTTQVHQFAIPGRDPAVYVASGEVEGGVLNQFSMSEHAGHLRVATTVRKADGATDNVIHVLTAKKGRLERVGRLGGLGHEGESIQSVRFIGDRGYVVTFRQTDPLYVLDLRDPAKPKATGELQVPGFSSYLHPLSDRILLGVGVGPGENGGQGFQLSLFDVGDPARPTRIANRVYENSHSSAQRDHHAFLWWPETKSLVVPLSSWDGSTQWSGAVVVPVDLKGSFGAERKLSHEQHAAGRGSDSDKHGDAAYLAQIERSMVTDGRLLTLSAMGVLANDMATLAERSWTAWPA